MRLTFRLALRDLAHERLHLICNVAVIVGVIVPLMVLFGVKNGVYETLLGRLLANPAILQIDTAGNNAFTEEDAAEVRSWPETGFVTLKTRSLFDYVNVGPVGGRGIRDALLIPSGAGDPTLPDGLDLGRTGVAVSAALAEQLDLGAGAEIRLFTQADGRPRQLAIPARVLAVLPADRLSGRAVLADIATLDLVEAFYEEYALPEHGIEHGRPLAQRVPSFEGLRAYATDLDALRGLQNRMESRFGVGTSAHTREVESVLALGRNLDLALLLATSIAAVGLGATLLFGFWGEVARKRRTIATLALIGLSDRQMRLFPVIQSLVTAVLALVLAFGFFWIGGAIAQAMFAGSIDGGQRIVRLSGANAVAIVSAVTFLVTVSSLLAARSAQRIDPAIVLREAV